jgi:DNA-directed RNA polymerase beta subunit
MSLDREVIVRKFYEENAFANIPLESYNHLIYDGFNQMFDNMKIRVKLDGKYVTFKLEVDKYIATAENTENKKLKKIAERYLEGINYIFPDMILKRGNEYKTNQILKLKALDDDGEILQSRSIKIMNGFPLMVLSDICPLSKIPRKYWRYIPHCQFDNGGYFIYRSEKILVCKEQLAEDTIYTTKVKTDNMSFIPKDKVITKFLSSSKEKLRRIQVYISGKKDDPENIQFAIEITPIAITLYQLVYILSINYGFDINEVYDEYINGIEEEYTKYIDNTEREEIDMNKFIQSIRQNLIDKNKIAKEIIDKYIETEDMDKKEIKKLVEDVIAYNTGKIQNIIERPNELFEEYNKKVLNEAIKEYILPNNESWQQKLHIIFKMVYDISKYHITQTGLTDKNYYGYKFIKTPGMHIYDLYSKIIRKYIKIPENTEEQTINTVMNYMINKLSSANGELDKEFATSFIQKKWRTSSETEHVTIVEELSTDSYLNRVIITKKIAAMFNVAAKNKESRYFHPSSAHIICPASTPDNKKCGLTKHLTPSISITNFVIPTKETEQVKMVVNDNKKHPCYINNVYYGNIDMEDYKKLLKMKIKGYNGVKFHKHTSITLVKMTRSINIMKDSVYIFTTKGRPVYPVIVLKNGKIKKEVIDEINRGNLSFNDMLEQGIITYIDVIHSDYSDIALTPENAEKRKYDYMYISNTFFAGIEVNLMNFSLNNPVGRLMLVTKHLKQAISIPFMNWASRHDNEIKKLWYPQKQLFQSNLYKTLNMDKMGNCQNVLVAIATRGKFEQDDAFMMKKEFYERGGAVTTMFKVIKVEAQQNEEISIKNIAENANDIFETYFDTFDQYQNINDVIEQSIIKNISDNQSETMHTYNLIEDNIQKIVMYTEKGKQKIVNIAGYPKFVNEDENVAEKLILYKIPGGKWELSDNDNLPPNYEIKELNLVKPIRFKRLFPNFTKDDIRVIRRKLVYKSDRVFRRRKRIEKGQVLATIKKSSEDNETIIQKEKSHIKSAVIDDIFSDNGPVNQTSVLKIRLKTDLFPQEGDKFAFPYGQKGVLGSVENAINMPTLMDGRVPDIVINAQNFPSRNTIGLMLEMLAGKSILSTNKSDTYIPYVDGDRQSTGVWKPVEPVIYDVPIINQNVKTFKELTKENQKYFKILYGKSKYETRKEINSMLSKQINKNVSFSNIQDSLNSNQDFIIPPNLLDFKYVKSSEWDLSDYSMIKKLIDLGISIKNIKKFVQSVEEDKLVSDLNVFELPIVWKYFDNDVILYYLQKSYTNWQEIYQNLLQNKKEYNNIVTMNDISKYQNRDKNYYVITNSKGFGLSIYDLIRIKDDDLVYRPLLPKRQQIIYNLKYKTEELKQERRLTTTEFGTQEDIQTYEQMLKSYGYNYDGSEPLFNGETGQVYQENDRPILFAVGYASLLRLKHCVQEKYQARNTGTKSIANNQPLKGKSNEGGISWDEMMSWSASSFGIPNVLVTKLRDHSDRIDAKICTSCKNITSLDEQNTCIYCKSENIKDVPIPYSLYNLNKYNELMGNKFNYELTDSEDPNIVTRKLRLNRP